MPGSPVMGGDWAETNFLSFRSFARITFTAAKNTLNRIQTHTQQRTRNHLVKREGEVLQSLERAHVHSAHDLLIAVGVRTVQQHLHRDRDVSGRWIAWDGVWVHGRSLLHRCESSATLKSGRKQTHTKTTVQEKYQIGDSDDARHEKERFGKLGHPHTLPESPVEGLRPGDVAEQAELARAPMPVQDFQSSLNTWRLMPRRLTLVLNTTG